MSFLQTSYKQPTAAFCDARVLQCQSRAPSLPTRLASTSALRSWGRVPLSWCPVTDAAFFRSVVGRRLASLTITMLAVVLYERPCFKMAHLRSWCWACFQGEWVSATPLQALPLRCATQMLCRGGGIALRLERWSTKEHI